MKYRELLEKSGRIAIRPYLNPNNKNLGLTEQGLVVFPGVTHSAEIAMIVENGKAQYVTGLNEFSKDVISIKDEEEKAEKIREIREIVAELELHKNFIKIKVDDEKFWEKVITYRPDNHHVWTSKELERPLGNDPIYLDPVNRLEDLLIIRIIEAGGMPEIAKSKEDAAASPKPVKWYLDKEVATAKVTTSISRVKNKALSTLNTLYETSATKMLYIAKLLNANSVQYKNSTSADSLYEYLDGYINGLQNEKSVNVAVKTFNDLAKLEVYDLKLKAIIKDALMFRILVTAPDQVIMYNKDGERLGKSVNEVFLMLKNPLNSDVLSKIMDDVEQLW